LLPEGSVVRIYHVLVSANSRAETVEELEGRCNRVVVAGPRHAPRRRVPRGGRGRRDGGVRSARGAGPVAQIQRCLHQLHQGRGARGAARVARVAAYKQLLDSTYAEIETLGDAVSKGLALPLLANARLRLWLEDPSLNLITMGDKDRPNFLGLDGAQGRRLARRRLLLKDSVAGRRVSTDRMGRSVLQDGLGRMGGTATALALEDCIERRLITGTGAAALERRDVVSDETPLITQMQLASTRMPSASSRPAPTPTQPQQARLVSCALATGLPCARAGRRACARADSRASSLCRRGAAAADGRQGGSLRPDAAARRLPGPGRRQSPDFGE
jgi:hypothetical protein